MNEAMTAEVRDKLRDKLWTKAGELGWEHLSHSERSKWYENWSKDKDIGGILSNYMDTRKIRVYIKDSLLKPYHRANLEKGWEKLKKMLPPEIQQTAIERKLVKPHCNILQGGAVICWGNTRDWKTILISAYERAYNTKSGFAHSIILIESEKKTDTKLKTMINELASRLNISNVYWCEN